MGQDERRPTVYSAVPKNLTAPYVIPPLEHDRHGRPRPVGAPQPAAPRRRRGWMPMLVIAIAALIVVPAALGLLAGLADHPASDETAPPVAVVSASPTVPATPDAVPAAPDPAYPALDPAQLKALLDDAASHAGEQYTGFVEIQVGTESIPTSLRDTTGLVGFAGAQQPARTLQNAENPVALIADPGVLDTAVRGDVLRIRFRVTSADDRTTVYNGSGIAELRVVSAEKVASFS
ncbi:conserved hypothetical protein [Microbacterium sp. 8M]|uniref:hypothetical protein n=1 Tax=Microbacterium sp. 8M TaxID=2653153 RepID=UPI0012F27168|nr:hypothetical protein [Microbacterium sp. 8M]VXB92094.1 conserved hypothetical protein [Microbacterium sp. 8M]